MGCAREPGTRRGDGRREPLGACSPACARSPAESCSAPGAETAGPCAGADPRFGRHREPHKGTSESASSTCPDRPDLNQVPAPSSGKPRRRFSLSPSRFARGLGFVPPVAASARFGEMTCFIYQQKGERPMARIPSPSAKDHPLARLAPGGKPPVPPKPKAKVSKSKPKPKSRKKRPTRKASNGNVSTST
jgi:hypothetical protein